MEKKEKKKQIREQERIKTKTDWHASFSTFAGDGDPHRQ